MSNDKLKDILKAALTTNNTGIIYTCISNAIKEARKTNMTNTINILIKAQSCETIDNMKIYIKNALQQVEKEEQKNKGKPTGYLKSIDYTYTKEYEKDRKKYTGIIHFIDDTEKNIMTWSNYNRELHEKMKKGKWKGYIHARINDNFRIMYITTQSTIEIDGEEYAGNIITFKRIVKHDEIEP